VALDDQSPHRQSGPARGLGAESIDNRRHRRHRDWNKHAGYHHASGAAAAGVHEFDSDLDPEDDQSSTTVAERLGTGRVSPVGTGISDMLVALWDAAERVPVDPPGGERSSGSTSSDIPAPNPLSSQ
jgi:hypothetical protein